MATNPEISAKAGQALGLPPGFKVYSPFPFKGMNWQDAPHAIEDHEFVWLENFVRLGNGSLRTLYDHGDAYYTAPAGRTIVYFSFYTLATTQYAAIFLDDGSAVQLNIATLSTTTIGPAGTFYNASTGYKPFCKQWGSIYLLICNRNTTNDYWAWDGTLLYGAGTAAPQGVNLLSAGFSYSSTPTVTAFGGTGSGMTFNTVVNNGGVAEINITNPGTGYNPGDVVQLMFSGGGSDTSAELQAVLTAGSVGGAAITAAGSGYVTATVTFSAPPSGTTATGTAIISTGEVTGYTGLIGGSGYTSAPSVSFTGGVGSGAAATAVVSGGAITSLIITNSGSGYTSPPTIAFTGGGGAGANATMVISGAGTIIGITITNPGSGYVTAPTINITSGTGTSATAKAVLKPTGVASITVLNNGTGFTSVPTLTVTGGGGSGATALAVLTGTSVSAINVTASGSGYSSAPSVQFKGGGSGATLPTVTVNMNGDKVGSITITDAGANITDNLEIILSGGGGSGAGGVVVLNPTSIASVVVSSTGKYYTTAPAVEISPGANSSAYATVSLMPYGISGSAMETFLSRVWIINPAVQAFSTIPPGNLWNFSAPGSVYDFATSSGGGAAVNTDAFLQTQYTNVRQSSGYLYFWGNGSVSVVSNVNTSGSPATTNYNYQNVDPQSGLDFRDTVQDFGKSIIAANNLGIFGLYGGSLANISLKLAQLFANAVYPDQGGIEPSSAVATLYNIKHYLNFLTLRDPDTGVARNLMVVWNEKDWSIASQTIDMTFINTQKVASKYHAWGTDGSSLYPLFVQPSAQLEKRIDTKNYGANHMFIQKQALAAYVQATDHSTSNAGISGTLELSISGLATQNSFDPSLQSGIYNAALRQPNFKSPEPFYGMWGTSLEGIGFVMTGIRFTTTSPDFTLGNLVLGYADVVAAY